MSVINDLSNSVLGELAQFVLGKEIGRGMSRVVVEHPFDPELIIKIEDSTVHFQNVIEWETWRQFEYCPNVKKWLAPCLHISHSGTFLIQAKARDLRPGEQPKMLPKWISDHKMANFGIYKGKVVCRDYGLLTLNPDNRLRKWQGETP